MESSDNEFSDLEFDSDYDDDYMMDVDNQGGQHSFSPPYDNPDPDPSITTVPILTQHPTTITLNFFICKWLVLVE